MTHGTWAKIKKVTADTEYAAFPAGDGLYVEQPVYEIVWIETVNGDLYSRALNVGDTVEFLVTYYEKRGLTDSKCIFERNIHNHTGE